MNDNLRYLLAGVLIFIIIIIQPIYLDWLGLNTPTETSLVPDDPLEKISERSYVPPVLENNTEKYAENNASQDLELISKDTNNTNEKSKPSLKDIFGDDQTFPFVAGFGKD